MVRKIFLLGVIALILPYTQSTEVDAGSDDLVRVISKRQTYDHLTSAEIEQQKTALEGQLRQLNQRRRNRYDNDRKCCEKSLEAEDDVDESPCCQRLQKQKCPYREEKRCGVPEVRYETRQREVKKRVTKIIEVTAEPPENFIRIERLRISKLENDLRALRETEETRLLNSEESRRLALEDELRRDLDDEEARLTALERNRRDGLEQELRRLQEAEIERMRSLNGDLRRNLESQLEAERRTEEAKRLKREETLRANLEAQLGVDNPQIKRVEEERRSALEYDLQTDRQNALSLRKKRHDERRGQLEFELREQRKRDLDRLAELEEQRRREFEEELRRLKPIAEQRRTEVIETDEISYEPYQVPIEYESQKQACCYRCAGQSCGSDTGCNTENGDCPLSKKRCDKCRCNHSFVSCPNANLKTIN